MKQSYGLYIADPIDDEDFGGWDDTDEISAVLDAGELCFYCDGTLRWVGDTLMCNHCGAAFHPDEDDPGMYTEGEDDEDDEIPY